MFYAHFCAHGRLNGPSEVKDETPFTYAHAEIRTRMVVICGPTRYQLYLVGALEKQIDKLWRYLDMQLYIYRRSI